MRHYAFGVLLVFGLTTSAMGQSPASKVAAQKGWHATFESARAEAQKTGKPLMVIFRCDP